MYVDAAKSEERRTRQVPQAMHRQRDRYALSKLS
jgi:hypothetical protein